MMYKKTVLGLLAMMLLAGPAQTVARGGFGLGLGLGFFSAGVVVGGGGPYGYGYGGPYGPRYAYGPYGPYYGGYYGGYYGPGW